LVAQFLVGIQKYNLVVTVNNVVAYGVIQFVLPDWGRVVKNPGNDDYGSSTCGDQAILKAYV
jgi:hypothetical protein